jgi:hypothetical protein
MPSPPFFHGYYVECLVEDSGEVVVLYINMYTYRYVIFFLIILKNKLLPSWCVCVCFFHLYVCL